MTWEENNYLVHYGVPGMQKGRRRYQNEDGSYTEEGKQHYGIGDGDGNASRIRMSNKGVYEYMKSGRRARSHLKDEYRMYKKSAKVTGDKEYMQDVKNLRKDYKELAKQHARGRLSDADRIALTKGESRLDEMHAEALGKYIKKNRKNIKFA